MSQILQQQQHQQHQELCRYGQQNNEIALKSISSLRKSSPSPSDWLGQQQPVQHVHGSGGRDLNQLCDAILEDKRAAERQRVALAAPRKNWVVESVGLNFSNFKLNVTKHVCLTFTNLYQTYLRV